MIKKCVALVAAFVATLALAGCADDAGESGTTKVRIGYIPGAHDVAQLFVAEEKGYFAEEGISLEITPFQTGIALSNALTGGSLDVGVMGAVIANFPAKGQGKLFLLNNQQVDVHQIWAAPGSGIERIEDLRGKTMATTTGTASDLVLQVALEKAGLTRKDVEVVNLEMPAVANTFVTGGVPAASLWAPFDTQVRQNLPEATMIASAKDLDSPISGGWVAGNEFYDQHRDALEGIARAWKRANADLVADPAAGLELSCPRLAEQMPKDVCVSLYGKTEAYSNEQWAEYYQDGTAVGWVAAMQKVFGRIGALEGANTEAEDYFDTSIFLAADA